MAIFEETRKYVQKLGLPGGDADTLPASTKTFPDGALYRLEVPTVNSAACLKSLLETATKLGITINRVDETYGGFRHTLQELREYAKIAAEYKVELNISIGPRATYDTSATRLSQQGVRIGYRLRGMEQVLRAVEDAKRILEVGIRGLLIYDEGLLWLLNNMRKDGLIPINTHFKLSAHCGHGNPASFKVLEMLGADTINPVRDMTLPMVGALRQAVNVPLDIHTDNPPASGGFIRVYEAPEIVRVGSPVYLKAGNSVIGAHGEMTSASDGVNLAHQVAIVKEMMTRYFPEAKQSAAGTIDQSVPEI